MDEVDRLALLEAYVTRQRFLARLQAVEVGRVLFGSKEPREISTAEMLGLLGAE